MTPTSHPTNLDDEEGSISIENTHPGFSIAASKLHQLVQSTLSQLGVSSFETSILFTNDEEIKSLNNQYRNKDKSTDVLSFPQQKWDRALSHQNPWHAPKSEIPRILGDIVISFDTAQNNAQDINQSLDREVAFLILHGLLHLCGHDHIETKEETIMKEEQDYFMKLFEQNLLWQDCVEVEKR